MDQKLNIRLDIIKLLEENTGRTLWHKLQQDLFELTFQSNENKNKNKQMGLKLKSFLTAKETINRKTIHKIGENICKQSDWQGINLQNRHKTVHEALGRKTTQSKNRQKIRRFRKEDIQMAKKHMKRYSTSLNIRGNGKPNTVTYHFTPVRMAIIKTYANNTQRALHGALRRCRGVEQARGLGRLRGRDIYTYMIMTDFHWCKAEIPPTL